MFSDQSIEKLVGAVIHEMFHVFQFYLKVSFPNELLGIEYPNNVENIAHKLLENENLIRILNNKNINQFSKFIDHYNSRRNLLEDVLEYKKDIESIEGTGFYLEMKTHMLLDVSYDYYPEIITKLQSETISLREMHMYRGVIFCFILDEMDSVWKAQYHFQTSLVEFLLGKVKIVPQTAKIPNKTQLRAKKIHSKLLKEKQSQIKSFLANKTHVLQGEFHITRFDPMHLIRYENWVLHLNGITYTYEGKEHVLTRSVLTKCKTGILHCSELILKNEK